MNSKLKNTCGHIIGLTTPIKNFREMEQDDWLQNEFFID